MSTRSGFVAIIGKPNVGKSTLLNTFIGEELSIVTPKPQTTRNCITGIYTKDSVQIVFIDTPGILEPKYQLQYFMKREIESSFPESDIVLLMVDASKYEPDELTYIISGEFKQLSKKKTIIVLNKIDRIDKAETLHIISDISSRFNFCEIFPVSAKKKFNTDELLSSIVSYLPEGEFYFDDDIIASQPEKFFVSEIIRGEIMKLLKDELPFSVFVEVDEFKEREKGKEYIRISLILDKDSQKKIIIGKSGSMLKKIGSLSRKKVEEFLHKEVYLDIFVKVRKNWKDDNNFLKEHFRKHTGAA